MADLIDRAAAIEAIEEMQIPIMRSEFSDEQLIFTGMSEALAAIKELPSAQAEDWMGRNKERILQAGMEGREIEFRIGGRLFAIREKAQ